LEGFGDFKTGGQIIHTLKYADDLMLLAKEEKVLQDIIDKLIEIGRCYGMKMNVEKTKVMRILGQPFPVKIMIDQKQLEKVESFKYLGSILTNDRRCTCEIKCKNAMAKATFNKKRTLFTSTLDLELRKKLVKCYVWSIALYGQYIRRQKIAPEDMQEWHETNGQKLKVFSIILGKGRIWNNLDKASKKKTSTKNSLFSSKCLEKYSLQQNTFNVYYYQLSVEILLVAKSDTGTCDNAHQ
jgi:hypothetical protein